MNQEIYVPSLVSFSCEIVLLFNVITTATPLTVATFSIKICLAQLDILTVMIAIFLTCILYGIVSSQFTIMMELSPLRYYDGIMITDLCLIEI